MSQMNNAIAVHRAAWQAFQDAPEDPPGATPYTVGDRAELAMHAAYDVLLNTVPTTEADLTALAEHLDWYCTEEADQAGDQMLALHAILRLARAPGLELAAQVKAWFTAPGGKIDTPENLEHQGLEADAEVLRLALAVLP